MRSLVTGFVYTRHDIPEEVIDQAYASLADFFTRSDEVKQRWKVPGSHGQTGYTELLVETAAIGIPIGTTRPCSLRTTSPASPTC